MGPDEFDMSTFFGVKRPLRMSTLTAPSMVVDRLKDLFGDDAQFTMDTAVKMLAVMIDDLSNNRKEEYMSAVGMAILFDRAGGKLTRSMEEAVHRAPAESPLEKMLLLEVRERWDDSFADKDQPNKEKMPFGVFYHHFMAPYTGCYTCESTRQALKAIDFHSDGDVDWREFAVYLKWAVREYAEYISDANQLVDEAFRKAIVPAMRDEK